MVGGRKFFGLHTLHFTDVCEEVSWIVTYGDKKVAYSSEDVAESSATSYREQGYVNVSVEKCVARISCGEEYW